MPLVRGVAQPFVKVVGYNGSGQQSGPTNPWGKSLARKVILFQCDDMGVVSSIRKGSANESMVMHILRVL